MEYGWYMLNKIFAPFGFFAFEFFISTIFAISIGLLLETFVSKEYLPYVVLGYFSSGVFTMTLSAHRQLVVASIFIIAFIYLVNNRVHNLRDLIKPNLILYYIIIVSISSIHTSAYSLLIIPLLYLIPRNKISVITIIILIYATMFIGEKFLPTFLGDIYQSFDRYERMLEVDIEMEKMTYMSLFSYTAQILFMAYAYINKLLPKNQVFILVTSLLTIFLSVSIFSVPQLFRLNTYFGIFSYIAISIVGGSLNNAHNRFLNSITLKTFYCIWICWNALKVFTIQSGTTQEYKSILSLLFV